MIVKGCLNDAIVEAHEAGVKMVALIIDEQSVDDPSKFPAGRRSQISVLNVCRYLGIPVWAVLMNPGLGNGAQTKPLTADLGTADLTIIKTFLSVHATGNPNLKVQLEQANITQVIIMGWYSDQCVRLAAIGGSERPKDPPLPGLTSWGYTVLTCPQIQRVPNVSWAGEERVVCYTSI